jgi:hypothetical protein
LKGQHVVSHGNIPEFGISKSRQEESSLMARHPSSQRFHDLLKEIGELHDKKQKDYGTDADPFANVRNTAAWGIEPWVGALIRLNDKVVRLQKLSQSGELANEAAEDSMRDIAVYALIALVLYEGMEDGRAGQ